MLQCLDADHFIGVGAWIGGKLDIEGDNIRAATNWMSIAADVPNSFQQQAQATLAKIRESQ